MAGVRLNKTPNGSDSSREITPEACYRQRRRFLATSAELEAAALTGLSLYPSPARADARCTDVTKSAFDPEEPLTPKNKATACNNCYEFGTDKADPVRYATHCKPRPRSAEISGAVAKPGRHDLEDFPKPTDWKNAYIGCDAMLSVLEWPYREGLRLDVAMHSLTLLAVGMYGDVLSKQNGAPLRLIAPWRYGFKSIKSIVTIHFTETQPRTTWNQVRPTEYGCYANVDPDHRPSAL